MTLLRENRWREGWRWWCNCSKVWWRSFVSNESFGVKRTERLDFSIMRERLDMTCKIKKVCYSENLTLMVAIFPLPDTSGIFFFSSYLCLLVFDKILKWLLDIVNCDYYWPGRGKPLLWQIASVFHCESTACYSAEHLKVLPSHRVTALLEKSLITLNDRGVINHLLVRMLRNIV